MSRAASVLLLLVPLLFAGLVPSGELVAQERDRGERMTREQLEERIRARFHEQVSEQLQLTSEQVSELRGVMRELRHPRAQLARDRRALRQGMKGLVESGGDSQAEASSLLQAKAELREREAALEREEEERLLEILTPEQLLRFHLLREEFTQRIQRIQSCPDPRGSRQPPERRDA